VARTFPQQRLHLEELKNEDLVVGHEEDPSWGEINRKCFSAMLAECKVPMVCRKMFLGEPLTQYALSHQAFFQIVGNQVIHNDRQLGSSKLVACAITDLKSSPLRRRLKFRTTGNSSLARNLGKHA